MIPEFDGEIEFDGKLVSAIAHPPVFINNYLAENIEESLPDRFSGALRFFPTQPTDINALTEEFPEASDNVFAVYDRMFRLQRRNFPHIKQEQILYYFYKMAGDPEALIETIQTVYSLMDRGDESAQEINSWVTYLFELGEEDENGDKNPFFGEQVGVKRMLPNKRKLPVNVQGETVMIDPKVYDVVDVYSSISFYGKNFLMPYFHEFKIFQLEEARDIVSFGTARTYAGNKLIINYDWHEPDPIFTSVKLKDSNS
jgi:hypothetical protein